MAAITLNFEQFAFVILVIHVKDVDRMANSVDPDQAAPPD